VLKFLLELLRRRLERPNPHAEFKVIRRDGFDFVVPMRIPRQPPHDVQ